VSARRLALMGWDCTAWSIGLLVGTWLRHEGNMAVVDLGGPAMVLPVALVAHLLSARPLRLYHGRYSIGSVHEAIDVSSVTALTACAAFVAVLLPSQPPVPRSVPFIAALITIMVSVGARVAVRLRRERRGHSRAACAHRVIVLGADVEGEQLVRSMTTDPDGTYLPVAVLDDNPDAQHRCVSGVSVRGTHHDIAAVARATGADMLVVTARDLGPPVLRDVTHAAAAAGIDVKILPPLRTLLGSSSEPAAGGDLDVTDLLGRGPIDIDVNAVAGYLTGRRVLVTGAGGSIGSELCRQIHRFRPAELIMLDRDESALHATQLAVYGSGLLDTPDVVLADIRDADVLIALFTDRRPEVVFHAAALKHLPMLERFPEEAWRTNVIGTHNVLEAAAQGGAAHFVNISTDKAANPKSVLGRSKRIGERLVAQAADSANGTYLSVRFGNVLGSRGSVLSTFTEQIAAGGPVTITHPDVTRFLMTIPEAVQLVVHAAAIGCPGEVLVLDMGEPVRIADIARQLMCIAGRCVDIVYTGLRAGEKLHEELFGDGERDRRPVHPAVSQVPVPPLPATWALAHAARVGPAQAMIDLPHLQSPAVRNGRRTPDAPVLPAAFTSAPGHAS
jgi:FlaA1/EpsC-like NDP-sugar epimerase